MEEGEALCTVGGMQTGAAAGESSMSSFKKLKMDLPYDPVIPLQGIHPKNPKTPIKKYIRTPVFPTVSFTITKIWKQPKCHQQMSG